MYAFHHPKPCALLVFPSSSSSPTFPRLLLFISAIFTGLFAILSAAGAQICKLFRRCARRNTVDRSCEEDAEKGGSTEVALKELTDNEEKKGSATNRGVTARAEKEKPSNQREITIGKTTADLHADKSGIMKGVGLALANAPMEQDKVYFEVRVLEPGTLLVGAMRAPPTEVIPWSEDEFKALLSEETATHCGFAEFGCNGTAVEKDDVISCAFDQSDFPTSLHFALNGASLPSKTKTGLRGEMWPAVALQDGAVAQLIFDPLRCCHWATFKKRGFNCLTVSRSLIW
ncbi:spry domain-containing protein 7-like [Cystoisospora suis]|uniref:Spry domain-containing protein 7-like n=1 Tax=Cystoisospora suis TaxID=483139 RepID=A0A2C6KNB5_9APIC|nr:spry domain-containing protein 7-like [Cystoisospora suis]